MRSEGNWLARLSQSYDRKPFANPLVLEFQIIFQGLNNNSNTTYLFVTQRKLRRNNPCHLNRENEPLNPTIGIQYLLTTHTQPSWTTTHSSKPPPLVKFGTSSKHKKLCTKPVRANRKVVIRSSLPAYPTALHRQPVVVVSQMLNKKS